MNASAFLPLGLAAVVCIRTAAASPAAQWTWTPAGVSSELFESHPAFDPITRDDDGV